MVESRDSRTVILSDGIFDSHQTAIVDSFSCIVCIFLFKLMHALLIILVKITQETPHVNFLKILFKFEALGFRFLFEFYCF